MKRVEQFDVVKAEREGVIIVHMFRTKLIRMSSQFSSRNISTTLQFIVMKREDGVNYFICEHSK